MKEQFLRYENELGEIVLINFDIIKKIRISMKAPSVVIWYEDDTISYYGDEAKALIQGIKLSFCL